MNDSAMNTMKTGLLTPSDIADLAGVSRGAVSNWRKRRKDFPQPVNGSASKPLFAAAEIDAWLTKHAKRTDNPELVTDQDKDHELRLWTGLSSLRREVSPPALMCALLEAAVAAKTGGESAPTEWNPLTPEQRKVISHAVAGIDPQHLPLATDGVLERINRTQGRTGGESGYIGSRVSHLLAQCARLHTGTIYDPACGIASVLVEALGPDTSLTTATGHEFDPQTLHIAQLRSALHAAPIDFAQADVLIDDPAPNLRVDVVVAEPPFGRRMPEGLDLGDARWQYGVPPRSSVDLAWLQHAIAHLTPGGRAYVVTSQRTLSSFAEGKVRRALVEAGAVKAVIGLPGKMHTHTSIPLALWVLGVGGNQDPTDDVLLVDAADVEDPEEHTHQWVQGEGLADVPHSHVSVNELLDDPDLLPARWTNRTTRTPDEIRADFQDAHAATGSLIAGLVELQQATRPHEAQAAANVLTVGDLLQRKLLSRVPITSGRTGEQLEEGHLITAQMVRRGWAESDVQATPGDERATLPGDILVATVGQPAARVDREGGHRTGTGVEVLRLADESNLSPQYVCQMLGGPWNERFAAGTLPRVRIQDLEIPVIPLRDQEEAATNVAVLTRMEELTQQLRDRISTTRTAMLEAVREGVDLNTAKEETS